ncbi:MAG: ABC transporter ATP-binding protein [Intrasporangium sp.]|uniref:ABC transporter ATP-binding protein n=1 Tax=Intrasporangium sp. TaxID=1925024 RepID=UPI002649B44F|nr:ABC transporter ATP-binding protein [Intrasporangium sp.]MDN5795030.1 ABC transporter ATP-binding protein [Intrasporangium sp.]
MDIDLAPAIDLRDLVKTFRGTREEPVRAVDGIDLTVRPGEIVAFLGPNGAGKTTTLDMVLGLTEPTSGTARVFGRPPREAIRAGRVSAVLQTGGLLRDITVRETVRLIASTYAAHTPVEEVIDRAGLGSLADRRVSKCSGGEQQRLRFALALLPDPDLLVLDEPTAGMDVTARHDFWATMHDDADSGRTVVFATHYLEEADAFADRIVLVAKGRVIADGTTAEIRGRAAGRQVSARVDDGALAPAISRLRTTASVIDVTERGDRVVVTTSDSDAVALLLLTDLGGRDLEVSTVSLDQAFMALTADTDGTGRSGIPDDNGKHHGAEELTR